MKKEYEFHIEVTLGNSSPHYNEIVKVFILNESFPSEFEVKARLYDTLKSNCSIWHHSEVKTYQVLRVFEKVVKLDKGNKISELEDKIIDLEVTILNLEDKVLELECKLKTKELIIKELDSRNDFLLDFIYKNDLIPPTVIVI